MKRQSIYRRIYNFASGGILAVLVNAASYPLLTHFYTPEQYGDYGLYLFFSGIFSAIASLKFELIIPIQKGDGDLSEVLTASAFNIVIVSLFGFGIGVLYYWGEVWAISIYVMLSVVFYGWFSIIGGVLVYLHANRAAGLLLFVQAIVAVIVQISLSRTGLGWYGLVVGYLFSMATASFFGLLCVRKLSEGRITFSRLSKAGYIRLLRENKDRWRANVVQTFTNSMSLNVLAHGCLLLGGKEAVGLFSFAQKILTIPVRVVGNAVRQVMLREYSITGLTAPVVKSMVKLTWILAFVSGLVFTAIGSILPWLVGALLDDGWMKINSYIWPLSIWLAFTIVYVPVISGLNVYGNNWPHTIYEIGNLVARTAIALVCLCVGAGAAEYILITSLASSVMIVVFIIWAKDMFYERAKNG